MGQARQSQTQQAIEGACIQDDQLLGQDKLLLHALIGEEADLVPSELSHHGALTILHRDLTVLKSRNSMKFNEMK